MTPHLQILLKTGHPKFRWYFEFPVERSKFKKTGHPKNSVVVGISGRTFEFPVERSKFERSGTSEKFGGNQNCRSNIQNSKKRVIRKFRWQSEFPVERSNFRSNVRNPEKRSNSEKRVIRKFRWYLDGRRTYKRLHTY